MSDIETQDSETHRYRFKSVEICFVVWEGIGRRFAARELDEAEEDTNLDEISINSWTSEEGEDIP
jgi:hypothetical protein